jgi:cytochrome c biogenesis protein CcmG/thiol:disulfide interchange protein DsbE
MPRTGRLTLVFIGLVVLGLALNRLTSNVAEAPGGALVGEPAPDFRTTLLDGDPFRLQTTEGPVILNFWGSWCLPCRDEVPLLSRFAQQHPQTIVVGLAIDDSEKAVRSFLDEIPAGYLIAVEPNRDVVELYGVIGFPTTVVIGADGIVRGRLFGVVSTDQLEDLTG